MPQPPTPVERFRTLLRGLIQAVDTRVHWGLPRPLIALIIGRIIAIRQRFYDLAERIAAGTYVQRRPYAAPRKLTLRRPRTPNPLPHRAGWLLKLVPEAVFPRGYLESLLQDPEMGALMAAAPAAMRRPLRSLCHMLGVAPPPILALPAKPRPPPKPRPAASAAPSPAPDPQPPEWLRGLRRSLPQFSRPRIRPPPKPA